MAARLAYRLLRLRNSSLLYPKTSGISSRDFCHTRKFITTMEVYDRFGGMMSRPAVLTTLLIFAMLVIAAAAAGIGLMIGGNDNSTTPSASPTATAPTVPDESHCYIEIQAPRTPILWLETPRQGDSDESCQAIVEAAQGDSPSGTAVFMSGRPSPSVVVLQNGSLTVLALPGTVTPEFRRELEQGIGKLLGGDNSKSSSPAISS
jgi:hypothetical protein